MWSEDPWHGIYQELSGMTKKLDKKQKLPKTIGNSGSPRTVLPSFSISNIF